MKTLSTATLKLTLLPSGSLEIVTIDTRSKFPVRHVEQEPIVFTAQETKALKDFLNDSSPASA